VCDSLTEGEFKSLHHEKTSECHVGEEGARNGRQGLVPVSTVLKSNIYVSQTNKLLKI
jgi:hypothetical protein